MMVDLESQNGIRSLLRTMSIVMYRLGEIKMLILIS